MRQKRRDREWEIIGDVRLLQRNGTEVRVFEFRGEITGSPDPVLIVTDGWDVLLTAYRFPQDWRRMSADTLFGLLNPANCWDAQSQAE